MPILTLEASATIGASSSAGGLLPLISDIGTTTSINGSLGILESLSADISASTGHTNGRSILYTPNLPFIFNGGTVNKQREDWALSQARRYTSDALMWYGEQCVVRLKWRPEDFEIGLCKRCICSDSPNPANTQDYQSVLERMANVYKQSGDWWCPICYGTGFVGLNDDGGGFKPIIYETFIIAEDTPELRKRENTLRFWQENPHITMYPVPSIKDGDLIIRIEQWDKTNKVPLASGERFEATAVIPQTIRSGPDNSITQSEQNYNTPWGILVGQNTILKNLPNEHPFYKVDYYNTSVETINVQMNPHYHPHL